MILNVAVHADELDSCGGGAMYIYRLGRVVAWIGYTHHWFFVQGFSSGNNLHIVIVRRTRNESFFTISKCMVSQLPYQPYPALGFERQSPMLCYLTTP
jgi:hypothetical protein